MKCFKRLEFLAKLQHTPEVFLRVARRLWGGRGVRLAGQFQACWSGCWDDADFLPMAVPGQHEHA